MKKAITLTSLLFASFFSHGVTVVSTTTTLTDKPLQLTKEVSTSRVYVYGVELDGAALGCEHNTPVISLGSDNPQGQLMYETLLSAKKTGQKVILGAKSCWSGYSTPLVFTITTL